MAKKYLLALDSGIGGGRCVLVDLEGNEVGSAYQEWTYIYPEGVPGGVEFDPDNLWGILCSQIRKAVSDAKIAPSDVVSVSATAQREAQVYFDEEREIFACPCNDTRAMNESLELGRKYGERIYRITSRFWNSGVERLLWFKRHKPEVFKSIRAVLIMSDWMLYRFSGEFSAEPSNASNSGVFDVTKREWSKELLDLLGLPLDVWPEVHRSGDQIGEITSKAERETGLKRGTPVVAGGGDAQCGSLGTATVENGQIAAIAGTTTPIEMVIDKAIIDGEMKTNTNCHVVPDKWVLESNAGASGIIYRYFRDSFGHLEKLLGEELGVSAYQLLDQEAARVPPGAGGLFAFLASHVPGIEPNPPASILGLKPGGMSTLTTGRKEIGRAILENVCYGVRANIENIERASGIEIGELRLCGGESRSRLWTQIQADVLGKPVWIPKVSEATSFGAIICAGVGAGYYDSVIGAAKELVKCERVVQPDPKMHETYDILFDKWKRIYEKLSEIVKENLVGPVY